MSALDRIRVFVKESWPSQDLRSVCFRIIDHLERTPLDRLRVLTVVSLSKIANVPPLDSRLAASINILANSSQALLELGYLYDSEAGEEIELDSEAKRELVDAGGFVHPVSGELIPADSPGLIPFFSPSALLKELKGVAGG